MVTEFRQFAHLRSLSEVTTYFNANPVWIYSHPAKRNSTFAFHTLRLYCFFSAF
jgi:hypothetical protein